MRKASHLLTILLVGMYHFVDGATTAAASQIEQHGVARANPGRW